MKTFLRAFSIICLLAWMGGIFYFSCQTATESSTTSGEVIKIVAEIINPDFEDMDDADKGDFIASLQSVVRTAAHFISFGGLGFWAFLSFVSYVQLRFKTRLFCAFSLSALYAVSDEIHQHYVEGRSMQLIDIATDWLGIISAILVCCLFIVIIPPLRRKVRYKDRKKELVALTNQLYEKLDDSIYLQKQMEKEIKKYKAMAEEKKNEIVVSQEKIIEPPEETVKDEGQYTLPEDYEIASSIIGKTVVEATKICNELSLDNRSKERLELVNLILGRTEVLKAEILKILTSEVDLEAKKNLMKSEQAAAFDYFNSIKAQIS